MINICVGKEGVPDTDEFDVDIHRERSLEQSALLPPQDGGTRVHLVRERDLLVVVRGEQPDLVQHACEGARGVGAARESEETDLVACFVCIVHDMRQDGWECGRRRRAEIVCATYSSA